MSKKKRILIYSGPGASEESVQHTHHSMNLFAGSQYYVESILPQQLKNEKWESETALLIIPGGADIPYTYALNGEGNRKIRSYVECGGTFLGICAGSYYAGSYVEFAKGTDLEVMGPRELALFTGIVQGPVLASYDYQSAIGSRAAKITYNSSEYVVFYNGGGTFIFEKNDVNISVLGTYDTKEKNAAIIECKIGKGIALLSGVHFEYDPKIMSLKDPYIQRIMPELHAGNTGRLHLMRHLLERINILQN